LITNGGVTSPRGFCAGATWAGIKERADKKPDLALLYSEAPGTAAAVFTTNRVKAASVIVTQSHVQNGSLRAVVANSGCANACVGRQGFADAEEMAALAAKGLGIALDEVAVASTGVVGVLLPMDKVRAGIAQIVLNDDGGHDFARAIMTTDTVTKEVAVNGGGRFIIGGVAKGSGMICPNMATMLCFLTTDAAVEKEYLQHALRRAVEDSFNMIAVDTDTSPNDTVLLIANGMAEGETITGESPHAPLFQEALNMVCVHLAKAIARDGEGATKMIEVTVRGAPSVADARQVARTIITSPLVKSAIHGNDPNWGRIVAAAGRSGVPVEEGKMELAIGGRTLFRQGLPVPFAEKELVAILDRGEVFIDLNLDLGSESAMAWGCDLSEEYVTINSEYTT